MRLLALALVALVVAGCAASVPAPTPRPVRSVAQPPPSHDHGPAVDAGADRLSMGPCAPAGPPLGAVPPVPPVWCEPLARGVDTARPGPNSWVDRFDADVDQTVLPASYRVFEAARPSTIFLTKHFVHNGHWMVDVAGRGAPPDEYEGDRRDAILATNWGGALMRPDRAFRFAGGRLVVEFDAAAGMEAYHDGWPELVVTTAPAPTGIEVDPTHAIGIFGGAPTAGCRLYTDRTSLCSAFDGSGRSIDAGGRILEVSAARAEGAVTSRGGDPASAPAPAAWRLCAPDAPDTDCRDHFRIEFTRDSVTVSVNGGVWMEKAGLPPERQLPDALLTSDVYVYFASWAYLGQAATERFHWGRIAINP